MRGGERRGKERRRERRGKERRGEERRGEERRGDCTKNLFLNGLRFAFLHRRTWRELTVSNYQESPLVSQGYVHFTGRPWINGDSRH